MIRLLALLLSSAMLAACSAEVAPPVDATGASPASAGTNALAGTPMAGYGHDLNRARNVQKVVNKHAEDQAKAIEKATGGD